MLDVGVQSKGDIIVFEAEGRLTDEDYAMVFIPHVEAIIRHYGRIRLLMDMGDSSAGWDASALWDDVHFALGHRHQFEKLGVIGGPAWVAWGLRVAALLLSGETRSFAPAERAAAYDWIEAPLQAQGA